MNDFFFFSDRLSLCAEKKKVLPGKKRRSRRRRKPQECASDFGGFRRGEKGSRVESLCTFFEAICCRFIQSALAMCCTVRCVHNFYRIECKAWSYSSSFFILQPNNSDRERHVPLAAKRLCLLLRIININEWFFLLNCCCYGRGAFFSPPVQSQNNKNLSILFPR